MGKTIFAFDVGLASLGVAVNINDDIAEAKSLLIHQTAGCTKEQAARRGAYRIRQSHKEREKRLEKLWLDNVGEDGFLQRKSFEKKNGKWVKKTTADKRLEKEFPSKEEKDIVYTSSLLRIKLLEGEKLEKWQIYKALHASIQRRGYDRNVPWKNREIQKKKEDSKDNNPEELVDEFETELKETIKDSKYHYPCYLDAYKMGLWDNEQGIIATLQGKKERKKSTYTAAREYVEKEVKDLLIAAAKQILQLKPAIEGKNLNYLLWGEKDREFLPDRYPSEKKIGGLLAQKYPRFDNRIVSKCCLIRRLNVCKASKKLAIEVGFLLRLNNFRYESINDSNAKESLPLTRKQIKDIFNTCLKNWENKNNAGKYNAEEYAKCFKMTETQLTKVIEKAPGENQLKIEHTKIEASKTTGRSRFSQPGLYILKKLILSDQKPIELYNTLQEKITIAKKKNPQEKFGYKLYDEVPYCYEENDFWFLKEMKDTEEDDKKDKVYIPTMSLEQQYDIDKTKENDKKVKKVISSCNWPAVRHRLGVFYQELKNLVEEYGAPDAVHIEFVREDNENFMGKDRKKEYIKQRDKGEKAHKDAIDELRKLSAYKSGNISPKDIRRYRLFIEQNKECPYTGEPLSEVNLQAYEIDHIFPQEYGGPDAFYNIVLTTRDINKKKDKQLPCECDFIDWGSYRTRIKGMKRMSKEKKSILLASIRSEAEELIEKYTPLHATSYVARLARDITCLKFDWQPGAEDEKQKVFVFSGAITSRVAKIYKLYRTLGDGKLIYEKDRKDHRHHALDAMIISYLRQYTRDKNKVNFFKLPEGKDNYEYFSQKLEKVYPYYITRTKPALSEEPYQAWNEKKLNEINKQRKENKNNRYRERRKLDDKKKLKNLSKDPDERGQWYKNKQTKKEGVSQHGYWFYFEKTIDKAGNTKKQLKHKTIHSFNSPLQIRKMLERQGHEILGKFSNKQTIQIQEQQEITGTRLGRSLPFIEYGIYKIEKISKGEPILYMLENEETKIRMKTEYLYKIKIINNLLLDKQPFELDEKDQYSVKTSDAEEIPLIGYYRIESQSKTQKSIIDINSDTEYPIDDFDAFIRFLYKKYKDEKKLPTMLKKDDYIQLGRFLPYIKDGTYTIKIEEGKNTYSLKSKEKEYKNIRLSDLIKLMLIEKHLVDQAPFELNNYLINEDEQLTGSFKVGKISWDKNSATIIDSNNNSIEGIDLKCLIIELYKNQTKEAQEELLKKNNITIENRYLPWDKNYLPKDKATKDKTTEDNLSKQKIEAGRYLLKGFDNNATRITITSQNGTKYRVDSKILKYATLSLPPIIKYE